MEFLKTILGDDDLYSKFKAKIDEYNGKAENKDKQIKLGNLGTGEYVGKGKYDALQELLNGKETELSKATSLIEELKKGTKGDETLQGKITTYEEQIETLQNENKEIRLKAAIKVALLSEKAVDVDYLTYKLNETLKEKGETLELDENDNIKGWEEKAAGLKTQFPAMFDSGIQNKKIIENRLPENDPDKSISKSELMKKPYAERVKLYNENPEAYKAAMDK